MEQPQYNLLVRERFELEYDHVFRRFGLGATTWGPLRSGILSGKYSDGSIADGTRLHQPAYKHDREHLESEAGKRMLEVVRALSRIATEIDATPSQLAIAWCLKNPNVSTVILGASKASQLEENLAALDVKERMDAQVMGRIAGCLARMPSRRLLKLPGGRRLVAGAYALGLR
jgi:aryl-alcohol dehydrogenase-like predicted oxidoreductase